MGISRLLLPWPYCVLSFEAVSQLRKLGFKAAGWRKWKAASPVHRDHCFL